MSIASAIGPAHGCHAAKATHDELIVLFLSTFCNVDIPVEQFVITESSHMLVSGAGMWTRMAW